ncbi:MAG: DUF1707 domain-containing protein [Actinobacteria bacterium]|nr:MAG: DUF1707 domain-containing protein [Actinomycetota bacterium]
MTTGWGERPQADLRASDVDRDRVADRVRQQCAEGHITLDELSEMLARTYASRTYGELDEIVRNLPVPVRTAPGAPAPSEPRLPGDGSLWWRIGLGPYLVINAMLIVIWALTGAGYFWPIWPILGWGAGLALAAVGGHKPGAHGHHRGQGRSGGPGG